MVRAQIPRGELSLASVERLLEAAEAVCAASPQLRQSPPRSSMQTARRKAVREKWARIAQEAVTEKVADN